MEKKAKASTESGVLIFVIAGILVAVNALGALGVHKRWDTTKNERFTLSTGSKHLVKEMKQTLTVDAYVTKGLPKLDTAVRDLRDLLQDYKEASGGKFQYQIIDAKDEETKKKATDAGLHDQPFAEVSDTDEEAGIKKGVMGLVLKYAENQDTYDLPPPEQSMGLEFWISNKIRALTYKGDGIKHKLGVLTGQDELKLTEDLIPPQSGQKAALQPIITQNFPFYELSDVDLKGGDNAVDDSIEGLIITQPGKDFTEKELRRIDQFVMKGKSLVVIASAVNIKKSDATMNASLNTHGLEKLLDGYGIELRKDVLLDFGRSFRVQVRTETGIQAFPMPQFLTVEDDDKFTGNEQLLDTSFQPFFRMQEITVPLVSSIVIHAEKQPDANPKIVMRSTPNTVRSTTDPIDLKPFQKWKPKGEQGQFPFAAYLDGTIKTAFTSGDSMGVDAPAQSAHPSRIFVLASSEFLTNPLVHAGAGPEVPPQMMGMQMPPQGDQQLLQLSMPYAQGALETTILSFKNTLDWMIGYTDLLAVSAKIIQPPGLAFGDVLQQKGAKDGLTQEEADKLDKENRETRRITQRNVQWVLTLGIPFLFVLLGIARWRMRIAARANVSLA